MRIKSIEFDDRLLHAQQHDALVVFAGAGVSMGPPSNLPSFRGLAEQIAAWSGYSLNDNEPEERFLGRLVDAGIKVHERVVKILTPDHSQPTPLHEGLLRLFGSPDKVRIVTTNFDAHFETAADRVSHRLPDVYRAPALPLGNDFRGVVYLHGSVRGDPRRLVLTDQDFGRAYLTEGWATRFLRAMFAQHYVLFVGYSHNDTVMEYLARGLPADHSRRRFALDRASGDTQSERRWRFRGIEPITYALDAHGAHTELVEGIAGWADRANRGALDVELRIKQLVSSPPLLDPELQDEIKSAFQDIAAVRFFTRHAALPEWLTWVSERGFLKPLFSSEQPSPIGRELANWVATRFALPHPDVVFAVIERHGQTLGRHFAYSIIWELAYRDPTPDKDTLGRWVPVLLQTRPPDHDELASIMNRCLAAGANAAAVQLFEYLTAPTLKLKKPFLLPDEPIGPSTRAASEIGFVGNHYWLNEAWTKTIRSRLGELTHRLWPIVVRNLQLCYEVLASWGKANAEDDWISWRRAAIEPHEQDQYPEIQDVLIDAARDMLEWAIEHAPVLGRAMIEQLATSEPVILKRLAIHGLGLIHSLSADEKILWLLDKSLLMARSAKHEVFRVLKGAYPDASSSVRARLLDDAFRHIDARPTTDEKRSPDTGV